MLIIAFAYSCKNSKTTEPVAQTINQQAEDSTDFFPVTSFIRGELHEIRANFKLPLKKMNSNGRTDSAWIKMDELEKEFAEFLKPEIDSSNQKKYFDQTSFLDQTLNSATFTYDPIGDLPDSLTLRHWDVYIDPETAKVTRIYILKKASAEKTLQLTWLKGAGCKIVTLMNKADGSTVIESEQEYTWNY